MRPVELQPAVVQAPNVERVQQNQQNQPQISQQTFAGQLERIGSERPAQVQPPEQSAEARPGKVVPEEHGERRRKKPERRKSAAAPAPGPEVPPPAPGSTIDIRV